MKKGRWARFAMRCRVWKRGRLGAVCRVLVFTCVLLGVVFGINLTSGANNEKASAISDNVIGRSVLDATSLDEFSQNRIWFYYPCDGISGSNSTSGSCPKLAELRQAMWNEASQEDKESFMKTVCEEDCSIAGVEGYMNQIISHHGTNGELHDWLTNQCEKFRPADAVCVGSHKITSEEQAWIDEALGGSNHIRFAIGNASGGSDVHAGKIVCVWDKDKQECRDDVDYSKNDGEGPCYDYSPDKSGECWGLEEEDKWARSMESQCGGNNSLGSTVSTSTGASVSANSSITWDEEGWITGGMEGFIKEESEAVIGNGKKYESGKPNKILLHFTEGTQRGLDAYGLGPGVAAHFTIDLLKKETHQHVPISRPSGAAAGDSDKYDVIQIEIVGYGFERENPDNPGPDSKCLIVQDGKVVDHTDSEYCFAKFGNAEWDYLAQLLKGISKWGKDNNANIPLTTSVTWTGDVGKVRLSKSEFDKTVGIVGHMHIPENDHKDPGNIWPMVQAALGEVKCDLNGNEDSISGAKNAEKQASEVGKMTVKDVKAVISNYGDLAYRTGQAYGLPWVGILAQAMNESPTGPGNNFWGIKGGEDWASLNNLGEGFKLYGKTTQQDRYKEALKEKDPYEYIKKLGEGGWCVEDGHYGYSKEWLKSTKSIVKSLMEYIESEEGKQAIAEFGATNCDTGGKCSIADGTSVDNGTGSSAILAAIEKIMDLAAKNGSRYSLGSGRSIKHFKDVVNNGAENIIDCTGFASMVYWMVYEDEFEESDIFDSNGIVDGHFPSYKEVDRSDVRPGDIFAYRGHGGIVVEVENGKVTRIAEVNAKEGKSGKNENIGYSGKSDYSVKKANSSAGHFYRWKGDNS